MAAMATSTPRLLLLTFEPFEDGVLPLFASSNASPVKASWLEPAGTSFHTAALRLSGYGSSDSENDDDDDGKEEKKFPSSSPSVNSFQFKAKKKQSGGSGGDGADERKDYYGLLGLGHLRFLATEDQIRKCYRETALKYHPDKLASLLLTEETEAAKEAKKEEIDQHFKAIQEAYETLLDPIKRRVYDSTDEFDDAVPEECSPQDFFNVFGTVFLRNGRWSLVQPVPPLGDDTTTLDEVDKFYDFWYAFKSWREFPHADEFEVEQAESREHKRWMERQNGKLREKAKKEEITRIRSLVENAFKRDPRILRRKEEEKAEKLRKKQAKLQAKIDKEEEAARLLLEEKLRKEEEDKKAAEEAAVQKKLKEKEKKLKRKEKSRLRVASAGVVSQGAAGISEDSIESLGASLDSEQLKCLCDSLEGKNDVARGNLLNEALVKIGQSSSSSSSAANETPPIAANGRVESKEKTTEKASVAQNGSISGKPNAVSLNLAEKKERPWGREEVELLRKAIQKYPKGTAQRWEVISSYLGTERSVEEILKAIKTVLLQKPDTSKVFDSFLEKRKASAPISSPLTVRDKAVSAATTAPSVTKPNSKEAMEANNSGTTTEKPDKVAADPNTKEEEKKQDGKVVQASVDGEGAASERDIWSEVQEGALVKALKAFPKDTPQRWERIAAAVPGRSKIQCFKKFAELRDNFRNKKSAE